MKILLACLMCLVLTFSQAFAIDGGPGFGGGGSVRVTGTYAGVFVPIPTELDPGPPPVTLKDNSLALFTFKVPAEGLATGTSAVFRNGIFYTGTILGSADPDSGKLTGIVAASFKEISSQGETSTTFLPQYDANGKFENAKIKPNTNFFSFAAARIRGTASLTYRNSKEPPDPVGDSGGPYPLQDSRIQTIGEWLARARDRVRGLTFSVRRQTDSGFTLLEVVTVVVIIAILVTVLIPIVSQMRSRAQRVQCTANLRSLYVAAASYVQQHGNWPQIAVQSDSETDEQEYAAAWIAALKPFGATEKTWICPTMQELLQNPDYMKPENVRVDYMAMPFDDKPTTPHQWPRQPWFAEGGDVHGNGQLIIFTDGSISDLKTLAAKASPAP